MIDLVQVSPGRLVTSLIPKFDRVEATELSQGGAELVKSSLLDAKNVFGFGFTSRRSGLTRIALPASVLSPRTPERFARALLVNQFVWMFEETYPFKSPSFSCVVRLSFFCLSGHRLMGSPPKFDRYANMALSNLTSDRILASSSLNIF